MSDLQLEQLKAAAEVDDNGNWQFVCTLTGPLTMIGAAGGMLKYAELIEMMITTQQPHMTGAVDGGEWPGLKMEPG